MPKIDSYTYFTDIDLEGNISYLFRSQNNIVYTAYFDLNEYDKYLDRFPILLQSSYGFGFFRTPDNSKERDYRVLQTIQDIILDFLLSQPNNIVILYHCQTNSDNTAQAKRENAFQRKYEASPHNKYIVKQSLQVTIQINDTIVPHYVGFITKKENPDLQKAYLEMEDFAVHMAEENLVK